MWTVDTYETHPWRFRDARTGSLVCEYVAQGGSRLLQLYDDPANLLEGRGGSAGPDGPSGSNDRAGGAGSAVHSRDVGASGSGPAQGSSLQRVGSEGPGAFGEGTEADPRDGGLEQQQQQGRRHRRRRASLRPDDAAQPTNASNNSAVSGGGETRRAMQDYEDSQPPPSAADAAGLAGGFDGLGNPSELYTPAQLLSVAVLPREEQAVVVLGMERYVHPLSLLVGVPEARQIVNAAGAARGRRPTLLATWARTLQALGGTLERVVITRQVGGIFYARIVLSQRRDQAGAAAGGLTVPVPGSPARTPGISGRGAGSSGGGGAGGGGGGGSGPSIVSVDARPSDALALALEAGADVFVSLPVAELVQQQYLDAERELPERLLPPPGEEAGLLGAPSA